MLDDRVPFPYLGAGYPRANDVLQSLHALGHTVTFIPCVVGDAVEDATRGLPQNCRYQPLADGARIAQFVAANARKFDVLWVSRPHNMALLRGAFAENHAVWRDYPLIIYDAEALFSLRAALMASYFPEAAPKHDLARELSLASVADVVSVVSEAEGRHFEARGIPATVLSAQYTPVDSPPGPDGRRGFLFVGSLRDFPSPNSDALIWFCRRVAPVLREAFGEDFSLDVAGPTGRHDYSPVTAADIRILGTVPDLSAAYREHRVFIAPQRFAAGIAIKILESAAHGLPVVATNLLADQLGWQNRAQIFRARDSDPQDFAAACVAAYRQPGAWSRVQEGAREQIASAFSPAAFTRSLQALLSHRRD